MKKIAPFDHEREILLVDPDLNERKKAIAELNNLGFITIGAETYSDALKAWEKNEFMPIITDLHMPEFPYNHPTEELPKDQPWGLGLVAFAVQKNLPVVICSYLNHHRVDYIKEVIKLFVFESGYSYVEIPMIWDKKDWLLAGRKLLNIKKKKK